MTEQEQEGYTPDKFQQELKVLKKVRADFEQSNRSYEPEDCVRRGYNKLHEENMTLILAASEQPVPKTWRQRLGELLVKPVEEKLIRGQTVFQAELKHSKIQDFIRNASENTVFSEEFYAGFLLTYGYLDLVDNSEMNKTHRMKLQDDIDWKLTTMKKVFGAGYGGEVNDLDEMDASKPTNKMET